MKEFKKIVTDKYPSACCREYQYHNTLLKYYQVQAMPGGRSISRGDTRYQAWKKAADLINPPSKVMEGK